jgi:putative endonuclease
MKKIFHVYILASKSAVLYTDVTSNLERRIMEHKQKTNRSFTQRYNVTSLVWLELHGTAASAIAREKQIKAWTRAKRLALINTMNPTWKDLSATSR